MDLCVSGGQTPDGLKESCYFLVKFWQAQASARRAWRRGGVPLETVRSARKKCSFLFFFFFRVSTLGIGLLFALLLLLSTFVETQIDLQRYFC